MPELNKETGGKSGDNYSLVGIAALVTDNSGNARGLPKNFTNERGSSDTPSGSGFHNEPGSSGVSGMAHIQKSFASLLRLQPSSLHHGDPKRS